MDISLRVSGSAWSIPVEDDSREHLNCSNRSLKDLISSGGEEVRSMVAAVFLTGVQSARGGGGAAWGFESAGDTVLSPQTLFAIGTSLPAFVCFVKYLDRKPTSSSLTTTFLRCLPLHFGFISRSRSVVIFIRRPSVFERIGGREKSSLLGGSNDACGTHSVSSLAVAIVGGFFAKVVKSSLGDGSDDDNSCDKGVEGRKGIGGLRVD